MYGSSIVLQFDDVRVYSDFDSSDSGTDSPQEESESGSGTDDLSNDDTSSVDSDLRSDQVSDVDLSSIESNQAIIISQIDNLNNNLVTLQEDNKITSGLLFGIVVVLLVSIAFKLMYKILGLGQM